MVSNIGTFDLVFAVNADSPFKTLADFIARGEGAAGQAQCRHDQCRRHAEPRRRAVQGDGRLNVQIVPYRNSPDIVVALLRNDVQMLVEFPPAVQGQVADGKLRVLATSGPKRFAVDAERADRR